MAAGEGELACLQNTHLLIVQSKMVSSEIIDTQTTKMDSVC